VIFLFSADSDITPALDIVQEITSINKTRTKIIAFFPPGNYSTDLHKRADKMFKLENHEHKFRNSQLPDNVTLKDGYVITKPSKWV
jgi:uncharacterized LabA/DUF88 family protein